MWMMGREAVRCGVVAKFTKSHRFGIVDQEAQDSPATGRVADLVPLHLVNAGDDEGTHLGARFVQDPKGGVARLDDMLSRVDDLLKDPIKIMFGCDADRGSGQALDAIPHFR